MFGVLNLRFTPFTGDNDDDDDDDDSIADDDDSNVDVDAGCCLTLIDVQ